jgi:hypothetical protein
MIGFHILQHFPLNHNFTMCRLVIRSPCHTGSRTHGRCGCEIRRWCWTRVRLCSHYDRISLGRAVGHDTRSWFLSAQRRPIWGWCAWVRPVDRHRIRGLCTRICCTDRIHSISSHNFFLPLCITWWICILASFLLRNLINLHTSKLRTRVSTISPRMIY